MDLNERLDKIKKEIKTATDEELEMMGAETHMLYQLVTTINGKESDQAKICAQLLETLRAEWHSRHTTEQETTPAPVLVVEKCPDTYYQLMAKGDGSVTEPVIVK